MNDYTFNGERITITFGPGLSFFTRLKRIVWFPFSYVFMGKAVL